MILPYFHGIPNLKALLTWLLFFVNVMFYFSFSKDQDKYEVSIQKLFDDKYYIQAQGVLFAQIIDAHPQESNNLLNDITYRALLGSVDSQMSLGQLAVRNNIFKKYSLTHDFIGDEVQYKYWKEKYKEISSIQSEDPSYILGLSKSHSGFISQITYQFVHGGILHLASNLWFLLIFGAFLERFMGPFYFLSFYLMSGVAAANAFVFLSGMSEAPMIGASGAISGLMGLTLVLFWNKKINCFYWILPKTGYHGFKKFPAWVVLIAWFLSDVGSYLGTLEELGGVAHAAHIGGFVFGAIFGVIYKITRSERNLFASYSR